MQPSALQTAYKLLTRCLYVQYGCLKWPDVNIRLKHDVVASFPLLKWTRLPKSGGNWCNHTPLRKHANVSNTLYVSTWNCEVVWWEYQPQLWCWGIISTPQLKLNPQIWGQLGQCNGIRVKSYALETAYQWLKHFVCVFYGCMKQSVVNISLNHDIR